MSQHWSSILTVANTRFEMLYRNFKSRQDGNPLVGVNICDLREGTVYLRGRETVVYRIYINEADSSLLKDVGWFVDEGITVCLGCSAPFDAATWKHHCRACGLLACGSCCSRYARIEGFEYYGKQRVCKNCNPNRDRTVPLRPVMWGTSVTERSVSDEEAKLEAAAFQASLKNTTPFFALWKYGPVQVRQVQPRYVFLTSRRDRRVFVNVCTCDYVPRPSATANPQQQQAVMFLVGARGVTAEGAGVYDVAVNTHVLSGRSGQDIRRLSQQILAGMVALGLENGFSILYILPDGCTYQERTMSHKERDAAELDQICMTSSASFCAAPGTVEGAATLKVDTAPKEWVVALVVPSAAAFYHFAQICTTRSDLAKDLSVKPADWKKYSHIQIGADDGVLTPAPSSTAASTPPVPPALPEGRSEKGGNRNSNRRNSSSSQQGNKRNSVRMERAEERIPELNVSTRQEGASVLVRGVIHLPVTGGYVIEVPRTTRPVSASTTTDTTAASGSSSTSGSPRRLSAAAAAEGAPLARINILQHPVVDDLYALGAVVPPGGFADTPILVSEQAGTHTKKDGTLCASYHVAVESSFIGEVAEVVGSAFEARIRKVIEKINTHFDEKIDDAQFVVTPLPLQVYRDPAGGTQDVGLLLYEYPAASAAQARLDALAATSKGCLPLSPSSTSSPPLGRDSSPEQQQESQQTQQGARQKAALKRWWWPAKVVPAAAPAAAAAAASPAAETSRAKASSPPPGKKAWK